MFDSSKYKSITSYWASGACSIYLSLLVVLTFSWASDFSGSTLRKFVSIILALFALFLLVNLNDSSPTLPKDTPIRSWSTFSLFMVYFAIIKVSCSEQWLIFLTWVIRVIPMESITIIRFRLTLPVSMVHSIWGKYLCSLSLASRSTCKVNSCWVIALIKNSWVRT